MTGLKKGISVFKNYGVKSFHYHREAERTKQETGKAISKNAFAAQYCKQYKCVESTLREWLKEK